ncbi:RES domain-containing protein [Bacillus thuringiensis]|uniref:RES domain-containing protein n=1 Tax=Bacillus thuringiensis TaxID=1428 RepID=UPI0035D89E60
MCEKLIRDLFKSSAPSYRAIKQGDVDVFESGDAPIVLRDSFYAPDNNGFYHTWSEFKETVKHGNRFFDMSRNNSRENMLSVFNDFFEKMEIELKSGTLIWRARPNSGGPFEEIYDQTFECGPPPAEYAKSFRMNPDGISYFYVAEDKDTCIKEIRALETDDVVFGQFQTKRNLKLIDLSTVPNVTSPSVFSEDYDHDKIWARDFLQLFCKEISKPVDKETASIEYIPTQILTEYIRLKGYDGICYNSSLTKKQNYTLFCGRASKRTSYSFYYGMEPLVPNFKDWLELVNYEYVRAKSGEQS